jgi:predicted nucleic acid-binding protein
MKIRALLDTNILVAGFASQSGASFRRLNYALAQQFVLLATPALWMEYDAVLERTEMLELHGFSPSQVDDILYGLAAFVEPVTSRNRHGLGITVKPTTRVDLNHSPTH